MEGSCYLDERLSSGDQGPSEAAPPSARTLTKLQDKEEEAFKSCSESQQECLMMFYSHRIMR